MAKWIDYDVDERMALIDYSKILPEVIDFIPPKGVINAFRTDYNEMRGSFIYEQNPLTFDELLERVAAINGLFRTKIR